MGGVRIRTEDTAGGQHLERRLVGVHIADLTGTGLGPQENVLGDIEGVLHIPGGMVLGHIQPGEVMIVIFDLRAVINLKSHTGKNVDHFISGQGQGMEGTDRPLFGGQGDIDLFLFVTGRELKGFLFLFRLLVALFGLLLELVDQFAHGGAVFLGYRAQILHQSRDLSVLAKIGLPEIRQLFLGRNVFHRFGHLCLQFFDLVFHLYTSLNNNKGSVPTGTKPVQQQDSAVPPAFPRPGRRHSMVCNGTSRSALPGMNLEV